MAKARKSTRYTVCDGKLVLTLEAAEEGGYVVTSPMDPEIITQADSLEEAFEMARDVIGLLKKVRAHEQRAGRHGRVAAGGKYRRPAGGKAG
ncbi:MAG: type II toxin-antitoxin system HicB family antitoxin [Gemmataceae bacterium]|nr:type II toxin-antitoxin system HicB family antitoxin [Gemmataceae bacterium]